MDVQVGDMLELKKRASLWQQALAGAAGGNGFPPEMRGLRP